MRLSLLLEREDFRPIMEATLARYLTGRDAREYRVQWSAGRQRHQTGRQVWHGNTYLNFFALSGTSARNLAVIRREFTRTRSLLRGPVQLLYVWLATLPRIRRWFSHMAFVVTPPMSDAAGCILVPGNHRIRLLWPEAGRSVVILKAGFSKRYISAEVNLRETYAAGLAPALAEVAPDGLSFVEEYVEGTPINRLPPAVEQRLRSEALARLRDKVVMPTIRRERAGTWASTLECSIAQILAATGQSLTEWWRSEFLSLARRVVSVICECGPDSEIYTAMTHGDFQAGNILADGKRLWVIDWECADRRLASYDLLCLAWNVRLSSDWIGHVGDDGADDGWRDQVADWLGVDVIEVPRRLHAAFFVLEELRFSIGDAFDPNFRSRSARAESILARFREVVVQLERRHD